MKIRQDAVVSNKAVYLALGVLPDDSRDILGLWIEGSEGAKSMNRVGKADSDPLISVA